MALDFMAWPSIARLNREMVVTEKIDGTNAAIIIESHGAYTKSAAQSYAAEVEDQLDGYSVLRSRPALLDTSEGPVEWGGMLEVFEIGAQSRKRLIKPGDDNFGFARHVRDSADLLLDALGEGRHYGEWWGSGIQRGYGLTKGDKRFSLFNVARYEDVDFFAAGLPNVATVPVLYRGPFSQEDIDLELLSLRTSGSVASPGFHNPEGVVVYHRAANQLFKVTLDHDESPKSLVS